MKQNKNKFWLLAILCLILFGCGEDESWTLYPHNDGIGIWVGDVTSKSSKLVTATVHFQSDSVYSVTVEMGGITLFRENGRWILDTPHEASLWEFVLSDYGYQHFDTTGSPVNVTNYSSSNIHPKTEKTLGFSYNDHMDIIEGEYLYDNFTLTFQE